MNAPKRYHRWALTLEPLLPAREVAVAYLGECGFDMFEPSDTGVVAHGEEDKVDAELAVQLLDEIRAFAEVTCDRSIVEQQNWNAQWEEDYPKVEVRDGGGALKCTIRAPFHAPADEGMDLVVSPQMSFGTGHHATTHLMTSSMLDLPLEGRAVLDMGCGTGVLALVAGLSKAKWVLGIDIESHAVDNAEDNLVKNPSISTPVRFECGDGTLLAGHVDGAFDMVLANIHKNVLSQDMQVYARVLAVGGHLLLSGFFEGDVPAMQSCVEAAGLHVKGVKVLEGWACMACWKPM